MALTAFPCVAVSSVERSQPAAPLSPEATNTDCPWAAASAHRLPQRLCPPVGNCVFAVEITHRHDGRDIVGRRRTALPARPRPWPRTVRADKIDGGVFGDGARPLDVQRRFGFVLTVRHSGIDAVDEYLCGSFAGSPAFSRKASTSVSATSVRPTTAMLCPLPSSPWLYSGNTS